MTLTNTLPLFSGVLILLPPEARAQSHENKTEHRKKGDSGIRHECKEGPVVDNWALGFTSDIRRPPLHVVQKVTYGQASVTLNPDGSWNFSGQLKLPDSIGHQSR
jgi:hypothetical protein